MNINNPAGMEIGRAPPPTEVKVWDPLVRIFHWSLVLSFLVAWISADEWDRLHEWAGYAVGGLIAFRLVWGIIGTRYARFSNFVHGRDTVIGYLKDVFSLRAKRYLGHNPAGGFMIVVLLVMLSILFGTGYMLLPDAYGDADWLEEIHEAVANLTLVLVGLHVLGVIFTSLQHGENLVRSMFTGKKRAQ